MLRATFIKAAKGVTDDSKKGREQQNVKCYFCDVPVAGIEYNVKVKKAVDLFLQMNPQWLSFGKVFDDKARLCNQGYCLAAHFENWKLDYFGVNSPRGMRSPRMEQERKEHAEKMAADFVAAEEAEKAATVGGYVESGQQDGGKLDDLLRRTGASLASSLAEIDQDGADGESQTESKDERGMGYPQSPKMTFDESLKQDEADFEGFVDSQRDALRAIKDRTSTLDVNSNDLSEQLRKNREERLKVARRLQEMREKQPELEMRKLERQKGMIVERKRDLFEQMLQARMEKEEAQKKVDTLDLQQRVALMKIEEYSRLRKADESAVEDRMRNRDRLQADLEPAMKHMAHVSDAQEILERGLAGGGDEENSSAITQELQHALREAYIQKQEELLEERKQLTAGRFELESRLGQLKEFDHAPGDGEQKEEEDSEDEEPGDEPLGDDHENALNDDEPFEAAFRLATNMGEMARDNTEKLLRRIARNREEGEWLEDYPETALWKGVSERAMEDKRSEESRRAVGELLKHFFDGAKAKDGHTSEEQERAALDAAAVHIAEEMLVEACQGHVQACFDEYRTTKNKITNVLDKSVIDVLYGTGSREREFIRATGREYLTHGIINDFRRKGHKEKCAYEGVGKTAKFRVRVSQENCTTTFVDRAFGMGFGWTRTPAPQEDWDLDVDGVIDMNSHHEQEEMEEDTLKREVIDHAEARHWDGVYLEAAPTSPVMLPNVRGRINIIRAFYRKYNASTILVAGLHLGRFAVWNVPHPVLERVMDPETGVEKVLPQSAAPMLINVSPELNKADSAPIIDIREGTINSASLVMLHANGHVRVWDLNPVSVAGRRKATSHLRNMFPPDPASNFVPMIPSVIFHLNALELSLPGLNPAQEDRYMQLEDAITHGEANRTEIRRVKAKVARSKPLAGGSKPGQTASQEHKDEPGAIFGTRKVRVPPQPGKFPTHCCFHPSFTITGRNPSVMVGTEGGDVLKINMDFRVNDIDAPIVNLPPFVTAEFVLPQNAPDVVLAPANRQRKGNRVYRELFFYHKSPIVFMGVLKRTTDTIITIDEDGHVALWKYSDEYFGGTATFRPFMTRRLSTEYYKQIRRTGATRPGMEEPDPADARHLRVRKKERLSEEEANPGLISHFLGGEAEGEDENKQAYIRETYYPILSKEGNGRYIEYASTRRAPRPRTSDSNRAGAGAGSTASSDGFLRGYVDKREGERKKEEEQEKAEKEGGTGPDMETVPEDDNISVLTGDNSLEDTGTLGSTGTGSLGGGRKGGKDAIKITQWDEEVDAGVTWSSQYVEESTYQTTVMPVEHPVVMSEDGEEVYISLTYRQDNPLSKNVAGMEPYTDYVMIVTLSLGDLQFKLPYPKFSLGKHEDFHQFLVGPLLEETLTRTLFVHTSAATRLFSLETGHEILTFGASKGQGHFPYESSLLGFEPQLMALCPSQRVLAFATPEDSRIEINYLHHVFDGIDEELPEPLSLHPEPTNDYQHYKDSLLSPAQRAHDLSQPEAHLRAISTRSVLVHPVEPDQERVEARSEAKRAIGYIWEAFLVALEKKDDAVRRKHVAADVYGANTGLGKVHPTHWPLGRVERPYHYDTFNMAKVVLRDDESDDEQEQDQALGPEEASQQPPSMGDERRASVMGSTDATAKPDIYNTVRNTSSLDTFAAWEGGNNFQLPEDWKADPSKDPLLHSFLETAPETDLQVADAASMDSSKE